MAFVWFSPKMQFMLEKQDKCLIFFFPFIYQTSQWKKKKKNRISQWQVGFLAFSKVMHYLGA